MEDGPVASLMVAFVAEDAPKTVELWSFDIQSSASTTCSVASLEFEFWNFAFKLTIGDFGD